MPKQIAQTTTFEGMEDECLFTRAAVKADPDSKDLLEQTEGWLGMVDEARLKERATREKVAEADALRTVANGRLDDVCTRFADALYLDVGKDRGSPRWKAFFSEAVSRFVRRALSRQMTTVKGWLAESKDPVLAAHREGLATWSGAADEALTATRGTALVRGEAHVAREELARALTAERDGLHEALAHRARERGLPRDWPDRFFRVSRRPEAVEQEPTPASPPAPAA